MTKKVISFITFTLVIITILTKNVDCHIYKNLIRQYFSHKHIHYFVLVTCIQNREDQLFFMEHRLDYLPMSMIDLKNNCSLLKNFGKRVGVTIFSQCSGFQVFIKTCENLGLFGENHHWLILTPIDGHFKFEYSNSCFEVSCAPTKEDNECLEYENTIKNLAKLDLNFNTDLKVIIKTTDDKIGVWYYLDVYNPAFRKGGEIRIQLYGKLSQNGQFVLSCNQNIFSRRRNMAGVSFNTMAVVTREHQGQSLERYLASNTDNYVDCFTKFYVAILKHCQDYYKFNLILGETNSWGYLQPNGTFDGLVEALSQGDYDFGSPLFFREDRSNFIQYGRHMWHLSSAIVFRNPPVLASLEKFMRPLSTGVYISTFFLASLLAIALKLTQYKEDLFKRNKCFEDSSWSYLFLCVLGVLCQQGAMWTPNMYGGRITIIYLFLFSILLYQFYSGSILSFLLMKPPRAINSLEDLLRSNLKCGSEDIVYMKDFFKSQANSTVRKFYEKKMFGALGRPRFLGPEEGVELVRKGGFAFQVELQHAFPIIQKSFSSKETCDLEELQLLQSQIVYAAFRKNSPFRDVITYCINLMEERGIMRRETSVWEMKKPTCLYDSAAFSTSVGIEEFFPVLLILIIGIVLSLTVLILEIVARNWKKIYRRPRYPYMD